MDEWVTTIGVPTARFRLSAHGLYVRYDRARQYAGLFRCVGVLGYWTLIHA